MYLSYNDPDAIDDIIEAIQANDIATLRFFLRDGADPDARDRGGIGLLHIAARDGKPEAVKVLLDAGADPNMTVAITNHTPLFYACGHAAAEIIALLAGAGAKLDAVDAYGWTPLHMAAAHGAYEAVKALVKAGADVTARDRDGALPSDKARRQYEQTRQSNHWLCAEHLKKAEHALDTEGLKREKAERDIAALKAHNPKRFRLKF